MDKQKKAILVVSFGTSFAETRKNTIEAIEQRIAAAFPDYAVYRAWTSKMIISKLKRTQNLSIDTVKEAMARMLADGIEEVLIQPTHVTNGNENDWMKEDALSYESQFRSIRFGTPLLTSDEDIETVVEIIARQYSDLSDRTALVLMGHGTTHYVNPIYAALDYRFKNSGHPNIFVGTVEAYPTFETVCHQIELFAPDQIVLAPFMIVAGDHATNDMSGEDEDSWKSQLQAKGYEVRCDLRGLGEYSSIQEMFLSHVAELIKEA